MILEVYLAGWRSLKKSVRWAALATLAAALAVSFGVAALRAGKAPESTRYSDFGSRIVVRGGR